MKDDVKLFSLGVQNITRYGQAIATFSSFFNHSCVPDATWFTNEEGKILIYASRPIKKGSQVTKLHS